MNKLMPLDGYQEYAFAQMQRRAADFYLEMQRRRSVRDFSDRAVPRETI